jgi:hypothetical protein
VATRWSRRSWRSKEPGTICLPTRANRAQVSSRYAVRSRTSHPQIRPFRSRLSSLRRRGTSCREGTEGTEY